MAKKDKKKFRVAFIMMGCIALFIATVWVFLTILENKKPSAHINLSSDWIGIKSALNVQVRDPESGLRHVWIGLIKNDQEIELLSKHYPSVSFFRGGDRKNETFDLTVEPTKKGMDEGEAVLRVKVWDFSWRNWGKGNPTIVEKKVIIDTTVPELVVLSKNHNINQGGAGLVIYRLSESCSTHGVLVGDNFFPGYQAPFVDTSIYMAFIALHHDQGYDTDLFVKAIDLAENSTQLSFNYFIKPKSFRSDTLRISDSFISKKMPEFTRDIDFGTNPTPLEQFLAVNRDLRLKNTKKIKELTSKTETRLFWYGPFTRLPRAAPKADFADKRDYLYQGKIVDHQTHMGVDLASTAQSPVPAGNAGKIAYVGRIGIYGKTVIIDHGYSLFSMYSHLSQTKVEPEDIVQRGDTIGSTGTTGLAGGDHLHLGMLIHNTFINPREWWDDHWIIDNIISKLDDIKNSYNFTD